MGTVLLLSLADRLTAAYEEFTTDDRAWREKEGGCFGNVLPPVAGTWERGFITVSRGFSSVLSASCAVERQ